MAAMVPIIGASLVINGPKREVLKKATRMDVGAHMYGCVPEEA